MVYIVESDKSFYEASVDLEEVILRLGFNLLQVHDLGSTLGGKEIEFDEEAKVFEVGSPRLTERLLAIDVRLSMALPCRISIYTEDGVTKVGMVRPLALFGMLSPTAGEDGVLREFENKLIQVVDEAR